MTLRFRMPEPTPVAQPMPPEAAVILCCARTQMSPDTTGRLIELLQGNIDWGCVLAAAVPQGVVPLIYASLARARLDTVPPIALERMRTHAAAAARRNAILTTQLLRLLAVFDADGIRVIPFKGPVLAASVYGDISLRQFGDLDLLVDPADVAHAKRVLLAHGYKPDKVHDWEYHFVSPGSGIMVDLHEKLASAYFPPAPTFATLWSRREQVPILGRAVESLATEDLLSVLSVQLAKDCREWKQRVIQVCDTAELIRTRPGLDWDAVVDRADRNGARRILLLSLRLAETLVGAELPRRVSRLAQADPVVGRLADQVRARLFPELTGPPEAIRFRAEVWHQDSAFHLGVRERLRDRAAYLALLARAQLRLWLTPSARDRSFVTLPPALDFMYVLIRPIRVLRERSRGVRERSEGRG
jgi:hypothetical protein